MLLSTYLIDMPSATTVLSGMGESGNIWFQEFLPYAYVLIGIIVAIGILNMAKNYIWDLMDPESPANRKKRRFKWQDEVEESWKKQGLK